MTCAAGDSAPLSLQFNHRESVFGGEISAFGMILKASISAPLMLYVLFDRGHTPNSSIDEGENWKLSGAGLGLRSSHGDWDADIVFAWKLDGGDAQSGGRQKDPQFRLM